jgi:hypothetical protein
MKAEMWMYQTTAGERVIIFSGLLKGMTAAYESEDAWGRSFELARCLGVDIKPIFGYAGTLEEVCAPAGKRKGEGG